MRYIVRNMAPSSIRNKTTSTRLTGGLTGRLTGRLYISTDQGAFFGHTRVRLLEAIDQHGSISQAAPQVPLSYKAAWDAVDAMNRLADQPLVQRSAGGRAGGGTVLTEHGRRLVAMYRAVHAQYQAALDHLAGQFASTPVGDVQAYQRLLRRNTLRTSARNQFSGRVTALSAGPADVAVQVLVDGLPTHQPLLATITRHSASQLALAVGSAVVLLVKAPALQLLPAGTAAGTHPNQLRGTVQHLARGANTTEVTLDLGAGHSATAVLPNTMLASAGLKSLKPGQAACAMFAPASVILAMLD